MDINFYFCNHYIIHNVTLALKTVVWELFINTKKTKKMILEITDKNFAEISATDKPIMIDFWADWCGPCKMIAPVIESLAEEREDVIIGKVNVDTNPELSFKYGIRSIPTVIVLKEGHIVEKKVGGTSRANYSAMLDAGLDFVVPVA